jgi:ornithine cyclodeaminase
MTPIYPRTDLLEVLHPAEVIRAVEEGFVAYSRGEVVVPPVGHLKFEHPPGDAHIKYGYIRGDDTFTVKLATGFYENPRRGLPSSNGVMLANPFDYLTELQKHPAELVATPSAWMPWNYTETLAQVGI